MGHTGTKVQMEEMFPWEFAEAIARTPLAYLPLGTLEWHGEHNVVGLDALKAHAVCVKAAQISGGVVVPALYWAADSREELPDGRYLTGGVEHGERYHVPGSMYWLKPETYLRLLLDIFEAMRRRGFQAIMVVAGHWSGETLAVIRTSGDRFKSLHPETAWLMLTDQQVATDLGYPHEHAAGGETSLLMAIRPDLVDLDKTLETAGRLRNCYQLAPEHLRRRRATPNKYIGVLRGIQDESNDPETSASVERGQALLQAIAARIAERAAALLEGNRSAVS